MSVDPLDRITVENYEPDGLTRIGWLPNARACQWQEELSKPGSATFEIPIDDPSSSDVTFRNVVKLKWWHHGVPIACFAARITGETTEHAVDGRRWMRFENQPGVLANLGEATVYPQRWVAGDFASDAETTRFFGFMYPDDNPWYVATDWITPVGRAWNIRGVLRDRQPHVFHKLDPDAEWLSLIDPDLSQDPDTVNYFRSPTIHLDDPADVEIVYTCDQSCDFYHNNELIASGRHDWTQAYRIQKRFDAGNHLFAVAVRNHRTTTSGPNPVAFIATVHTLTEKGHPDVRLAHTTSDTWTVHGNDPMPGWHRANVLRRLIEEAKDRGNTAVDYLLYGFGNDDDSDGEPWTDRGQFPFDVAQVSVADVATQLSEGFMDVWVDPHTMRIHAYKRKGRNRPGVQLDLGVDGGSLQSYTTTAKTPRFTVLVTRTRDGQWLETVDSAAVAAWGRIERGMTLGGAVGKETAQRIAEDQLDENGHARTYATAQTSTLTGPIPYRDYDLGDSIQVKKRRTADYMSARVLAVTVDGTGDTVKAWPEFKQETGDG